MKRHNRSRYRTITGFLDLLFNMCLVFVVLFVLSFILINPIAKHSEVDIKGEYLITIEWDDKSLDDVDVWVRDPLGNIVSYNQKQIAFFNLDKDDVGVSSDTISMPDGSIKIIYINKEVVTLRGWVVGEYIINLHMFNKNEEGPTPVHVQLIKINPYELLLDETIVLSIKGQEQTVKRFTLNETGQMISTSDLQFQFVRVNNGNN